MPTRILFKAFAKAEDVCRNTRDKTTVSWTALHVVAFSTPHTVRTSVGNARDLACGCRGDDSLLPELRLKRQDFGFHWRELEEVPGYDELESTKRLVWVVVTPTQVRSQCAADLIQLRQSRLSTHTHAHTHILSRHITSHQAGASHLGEKHRRCEEASTVYSRRGRPVSVSTLNKHHQGRRGAKSIPPSSSH